MGNFCDARIRTYLVFVAADGAAHTDRADGDVSTLMGTPPPTPTVPSTLGIGEPRVDPRAVANASEVGNREANVSAVYAFADSSRSYAARSLRRGGMP